MMINRSNYEVYFVDFLDGNLSASEQAELRNFLNDNPDLAEELNGLEDIAVEPKTELFQNKQALHQIADQWGVKNRFDFLCIAKTEGDITPSQQEELNKSIAENKNLATSLRVFTKSKLKADKNILFNQKSSIKRVSIINLTHRQFITFTSSVAAVGLIIFGLSIGFNKFLKNSVETEQLVATTPEPIVIKKIEPKAANEILVKPEKKAEPAKLITVDNKVSKPTITQKEATTIIEPQKERQTLIINKINRIEAAGLPQQLTVDDVTPLFAMANKNTIEPDMLIESPNSGIRVIGLLELAQRGIERISKATGHNMVLNAQRDMEGNIRKIELETELFALSVPVRKKK